MSDPCTHDSLIENGWEPLGEYIRRTNPVVAEIYWRLRWTDTCARTRRTVQVTARKHRARRKRKR